MERRNFGSRRWLPWFERAQALILGLGAVYILAIAQLSPHPLPGLRWLALSVLFAGFTSAFRSTRFAKIATVLCVIAVGFGSAAVADVVAKAQPQRAPTALRDR